MPYRSPEFRRDQPTQPTPTAPQGDLHDAIGPRPEARSVSYGPRQLPEPAPDRIHFGSRLVLYKKSQLPGVALYVTHIKGRPSTLFVMERYEPANAIPWKGVFRNRSGVILADRDGVLKDSRFLMETGKAKTAEVMVPSALVAARRAHENNIGLGIVTNQGSYQTGQLSFEDTVAINVRVIQQIANAGGHVDAVFICPFAKALADPAARVYDARKPSPGMFLYAERLARASGARVLASTGDQRTDGAAAQAAGQKFYAVTGPSGRWEDELLTAAKRRETLPILNQDPSVYREVGEFADVVEAVLQIHSQTAQP